ncbi:MAG: glutathione synthase [Candidatus Parcubacteria bacterium]|nr:glutathione synthase [Burkholderiales bacterium]
MKLLFILDPLESLKAYKDTSVAMMRAAQARGHQVFACLQSDLHWKGEVFARAGRLTLTDNDEDWYRPHRADDAPALLASFDAVLNRKDPPFDLAYLTGNWLLSQAEREGARVFNKPSAVRDHNEKLGILEFPQFVAPTLACSDPERIHAFIDEHRDVILKRLDGMGGESIFRVRQDDPNRNVIVETMAEGGTRSIMAQRYIPAIRDGDKRILLIGGKAVPHALARIAKPGETRANLAAGGRGVAQPLSAHDRKIAETLAPLLAARGLLLVGLDVIGEHLTEVNVTSPTCFREIQDQTGFDVSGVFLDSLENEVKGRAP